MSLTPKIGPQLLKVIPQRRWHGGCRTLQEGSQNPKVPSRGSRVLQRKNGYLEVGAGRRHCGWAEGKEGWVKIKNRKTKQRIWEFQRKPNKWQTDAIGSSRKGCRGQRTRGSVPSYCTGEGDPEMSTVGCTMQRLNDVLKITLTWELYQCWTSLQQRLRDWGMLQPLVHELLF